MNQLPRRIHDRGHALGLRLWQRDSVYNHFFLKPHSAAYLVRKAIALYAGSEKLEAVYLAPSSCDLCRQRIQQFGFNSRSKLRRRCIQRDSALIDLHGLGGNYRWQAEC